MYPLQARAEEPKSRKYSRNTGYKVKQLLLFLPQRQTSRNGKQHSDTMVICGELIVAIEHYKKAAIVWRVRYWCPFRPNLEYN